MVHARQAGDPAGWEERMVGRGIARFIKTASPRGGDAVPMELVIKMCCAQLPRSLALHPRVEHAAQGLVGMTS